MGRRKSARAKERRPHTREEIGTDIRWVNWDLLAAFGEDERGYTYLAAILRYCCVEDRTTEWMELLVDRARAAHGRAGHGVRGQFAALRVFRRAGLVILHKLMDELGVGKPMRPRAAFYSPITEQFVIVTTHWKTVDKTE